MAPLTALTHLVAAMDNPKVRTATYYDSPKHTLRLTRQGKPDRRARSKTFVLTVGAPNYEARQFIKKARRAGEPFPIKRVQVRPYSVPR